MSRKQLWEVGERLTEARERKHALREQRFRIEQELMLAGEQYRMGIIPLLEYDRRVSAVLGGRAKDEVFAEIGQEEERCAQEEQHWEAEHGELETHLPKPRTAVGMQIAFALLAAAILVSGILVLEHPQGMVIYRPEKEQQQAPLVMVEPISEPWSTTTPQSRRAP